MALNSQDKHVLCGLGELLGDSVICVCLDKLFWGLPLGTEGISISKGGYPWNLTILMMKGQMMDVMLRESVQAGIGKCINPKESITN